MDREPNIHTIILMNPLRPKYHVPYNMGKSFIVPKKILRYPKGWEKFKGLPPWNQRQIR